MFSLRKSANGVCDRPDATGRETDENSADVGTSSALIVRGSALKVTGAARSARIGLDPVSERDLERDRSDIDRIGGRWRFIAYYRTYGTQIEHVPVADDKWPPRDNAELDAVLVAFRKLPELVLVDCSAGIDRTGTAVTHLAGREAIRR